MIAGLNLLNLAASVLGRQWVTYYRFAGRSTNANGVDVTSYEAPQSVQAMVQAVPQKLEVIDGVEIQRTYVSIFFDRDVIGIDRDWSGDQFGYNNLRYNVLSLTDWSAQEGWVQALCVKVGDDAR